MAYDDPGWGYRRIPGEPTGLGCKLGCKLAPSTVWQILKEADIDLAPRRSAQIWREFLDAHAKMILAADFFHVDTMFSRRLYVLVTWNPSAEGTVGRRLSSPARIPT